MMDLKFLIPKTAIDLELARVRTSMRRGDRKTIPDGFLAVFDKLLIRWGPHICRRTNRYPDRLLKTTTGILNFGHSSITKMTSEAKSTLVVGHETRYREQGQGLHRMPSIR